jgi:glutamate formiminotransferase/formiminotetrahydrofolate cyclodeaminase
MSKIIECVPNFSEGRRPEVLDQIVAAITSVDGTYLLDREMDADHNRAVVTFIGSPEAVKQGAFAGIAKAAELIDMNEHTGEHPRLGATDVCPFIPLVDAGIDDCIILAKELGRDVADKLKIPVYLYEAAATRPDRENLALIRKGQYEAIRDEMGKDPSRNPDIGEARVHPTAGSIVIGARMPLVAYNIYLNTQDLSVAKKIAKAIRQRSGGFMYCKALGFDIQDRSMVQVSMNLTHYARTPVFRVFDTVKREAERYGTSVYSSEIVGLTPQKALVDTAEYFLQLENFSSDQIIESHLLKLFQGTPPTPEAPDTFFDQVAANTPAPGGGSVAAASGALGAALAAMVARLTLGKKKFRDVSDEMSSILDSAEKLRTTLTARIEEDAAAFDGVMAARGLPRNSEDEQKKRLAAIERANLHATEVPLQTMRDGLAALECARRAAASGNPNSVTDAGVGALMATAAVESAWLNVKINLSSISDSAKSAQIQQEGEKLIAEARDGQKEILALVDEKIDG